MDMSSPLDMPVSEDVNKFHGMVQLPLNQLQSTSNVMGDTSSSDLGDSLTEFLHIHVDQSASDYILISPSEKNHTTNLVEDICEKPCNTKSTILTSGKCLRKCGSPSEKNDTIDLLREDICEEPCKTKLTTLTFDKCLSECETFACSDEAKSFSPSLDGEDEVEEDELTDAVLKDNGYESAKPASPRPVPLPTPLKLVSAMKGSREKPALLKKLTVTWAPDVYDPPPSDWSHVSTKKKQRNRNDSKNNDSKKHGKGKEKGAGKPIRGKDKKQARKSGGSYNKYFKSLDQDEEDGPYADLVDFDVGSPDSYYGSSFLERSTTKMHFKVAETT